MDRLNIKILGISETKWPVVKQFVSEDHLVLCSGAEDNKPQIYGTAFIIHKDPAKYSIHFTLFSERLAMIQLAGQHINLNVILAFAPTAEKSDDETEVFHHQLKQLFDTQRKHDLNLIIGDFHTKVRQGRRNNNVGDYGLGTRNEQGERLIQFCIEENLTITNTCFKQPIRRLYTWKAPKDSMNNIIRNQIAHILINNRFTSSIQNVKTYPGADISSDHNPVVATLRLKLRKIKRKPTQKIDIEKIQNKDRRKKIKNSLNEELNTLPNTINTGEESWQLIKRKITKVEKDILGLTAKKKKQKWMTEEILQLMGERRKYKNKDQQKYKELQSKIKLEIKIAKEQWMTNRCAEVEELLKKHDNFNLHKKLKETGNIYHKSVISKLYNNGDSSVKVES